MSETCRTTCDGCGKEIRENQIHLHLSLSHYITDPGWGHNQDLCGLTCLALCLQKMPSSVRQHLREPPEAVQRLRDDPVEAQERLLRSQGIPT